MLASLHDIPSAIVVECDISTTMADGVSCRDASIFILGDADWKAAVAFFARNH